MAIHCKLEVEHQDQASTVLKAQARCMSRWPRYLCHPPMPLSDLHLITYDCMRWKVTLEEDEKVLSSVHDCAGSLGGCKIDMGSCCNTTLLQDGTTRQWWLEILLIDFR